MANAMQDLVNTLLLAMADSPQAAVGGALFLFLVCGVAVGWLLTDRRTRPIMIAAIVLSALISKLVVEAL